MPKTKNEVRKSFGGGNYKHMKTYDEALDSLSTKHKSVKEIQENHKRYAGIVKEVSSNPRTKKFVIQGLRTLMKNEGMIDPYTTACFAFIQGVMVGMIMNNLYDDPEDSKE